MRSPRLTPEEWSAVWPRFADALDAAPGEAERLVETMEGTPAMRTELRRMLRWRDRLDDFLEPPESSEPDRAPSIPDFDIVRCVGAGGMGTVFEATQRDPPRRVALKVMQPALASGPGDRFLARFRLEAEVLARLRHPGIAQVHVAGAEPVPFIAMEFLDDARPITTFCREHALPLCDRLRLLASVCDAVHHAHQHGVIHHDLKPANVLVDPAVPLPDTTLPHPKIIDFGIARLTEGGVTGPAGTRLPMLGTLHYLAPEQCGAHGRNAESAAPPDVRTDVYALGVILHELVTGRTPFDLTDRPRSAALRTIAESPPPSLSTPGVPARRDLTTIVQTALAKDPEERYATALDLARDLRAYLARRPIVAGRTGPVARMILFARRQRLAAALLLVAATILVAGTVVTTTLAIRNDRLARRTDAARDTADEVSRLLARYLVAADLGAASVPDISLRDRLDQQTAVIIDQLADAPEVEWRLRHVIGRAFARVGDHAAAERHLERALALAPPDSDEALRIRLDRAAIRIARRQLDRAEEDVQMVLTARGRRTDPQLAMAESRLATIRHGQGRRTEAVALHHAGLDRLREMGAPDELVIEAERELLNTLREEERLDEALALAADIEWRARARFGPDDVRTLLAVDEHGRVLRNLGRYAESAALHESACAGLEARLGPAHPRTARAMNNAGRALEKDGRVDAAETWYRRAYAARLESLGAGHHETQASQLNLANVLRTQGREAEAAAVLGQ